VASGIEADVVGVADTIRELRKVSPALAREAQNKIKAPASAMRAQIAANTPASPLSGLGTIRPSVTVNYKGTPGKSLGTGVEVWPLVKVRLARPGWTVSADMARKSTPGESFTTNLTRKWGSASRWVWPVAERMLPATQAAIRKAISEVERNRNRAMQSRGGI
jgi:hypothetical protein